MYVSSHPFVILSEVYLTLHPQDLIYIMSSLAIQKYPFNCGLDVGYGLLFQERLSSGYTTSTCFSWFVVLDIIDLLNNK